MATNNYTRVARINHNIAVEYEPDCICAGCNDRREYRRKNPFAHPRKEQLPENATRERNSMRYEGRRNRCEVCYLAKPCEHTE